MVIVQDLRHHGVCAGRLEDKAATVRKAAMQLAMALLQYNPFGPALEGARLAATLDAHQRKLDVRPP